VDNILRWVSLFLPPFIALFAMTGWAAFKYRRQAEPQRRFGTGAILLLTPVTVAVATAASSWLSFTYVNIASSAQGGVDGNILAIGLAIFFAIPSLTLLAMLIAAWKQR